MPLQQSETSPEKGRIEKQMIEGFSSSRSCGYV
jgi:hypothetical protein